MTAWVNTTDSNGATVLSWGTDAAGEEWTFGINASGHLKVSVDGGSIVGSTDVRGGGQKPYRQKGTGRSRAGSRRSPLWRGGGIVFGPSPRSYSYKVSKRVRRLALKMALSSKLQDKALIVVDRLDLEEAKTKQFAEVLTALKTKDALVVTDGKNKNVELSSKNLPYAKVLRSEGLNVYDVLKYHTLVLLEPAIKNIEERLVA